MRSSASIEIKGIGKEYVLGGAEQQESFREMLSGAFTAPLRKLRRLSGKDQKQERIWALRNVSFEVWPGEVVGIIGGNGAGKSTLLKILSRITEPTEGQVITRGRVASLLEVGTGFHPELTGRENVYLNGAILGMKRVEIRQKFDDIIDFADVEKFVDTPVKRYSSGMYVRLAFAVAAHLEPEILVVDEVLAVGDAQFQKKCFGKLDTIASEGRTVLFVSHNMGAIRNLCERVILLRDGCLVEDSSAEDGIGAYMQQSVGNSPLASWSWQKNAAPGCEDVQLLKVSVCGSEGNVRSEVRPDEAIDVLIEYEQRTQLSGARFVLQLVRVTGEVAFASTDQPYRSETTTLAGTYRTVCSIPGEVLNVGRYQIRLSMDIYCQRYLIEPVEIGNFVVAGQGNQGTWQSADTWPGAVCLRLKWDLSRV